MHHLGSFMLLAAGLLLILFLPGALLSRLLLSRVMLPFAFLASVFLLTLTVTALNILRLPCTLPIVASIIAVFSLLPAALVLHRDRAVIPALLHSSVLRLTRTLRLIRGRPILLILTLSTAAILSAFIYKEALNPLPGYDASIRWEYLPLRILEQGHSNFYPPVSDADFALYALPDAMGMAVASQYWLVYALAGRADAALCVPLVVMQFIMILWAGAWLARALGARRTGAAIAVLLLAATGVVSTGTLIGQEIGLLTLAGLLLLFFLIKLRGAATHNAASLALIIGIITATAALTREYGGAYFLFAIISCFLIKPTLIPPNGRNPCHSVALYLTLIFALTAGPWLYHVYLLTDNPFYSIGVAGLFPKNPDLWAKLMSHNGRLAAANFTNWFSTPQPYACLLQSLPGLLGLFTLWKIRYCFTAWLMLFFAAMMYILAVWGFFPSLGDLYYSYRVAVPGIAVLAVALGVWLSYVRIKSSFAKPAAFALVALLTAHSLLTLLVHYDYPWRSPSQWQTMATRPGLRGDRVYGYPIEARAFVEKNIDVFRGHAILSADAYLQRALVGLPVRVLPPWTPAARRIMDPALPPLTLRNHLDTQGIRFIIVNPAAPVEGGWQLNSPWFTADEQNFFPRESVGEGIELRMIPPP